MPKYNFEEWKKRKLEKGEWLSDDEFQKKGKGKRKRDNTAGEETLKCHSLLINGNENVLQLDKANAVDGQTKLALFKREIKREFLFDTETTGLSNSDKIVELSLLEMIDGIKTGRKLHTFFNPVIKISKRASEIHGITNEKLIDAPLFHHKVEDIIKFIGSGTIIAHNATFDQRMLNNELRNCGWKPYPDNRFIDTLKIARFLYPKADGGNSQDALCKRFNIDAHNRGKTGIHSAYEDTVILYHIYQEMITKLGDINKTPYHFKVERGKSKAKKAKVAEPVPRFSDSEDDFIIST